MSSARPLEGRVAFVTGGTRGIGRAIALELGRQGASVAFCYRSSAARAADLSAILQSAGVKNFGGPCDVSIATQVNTFVADAQAALGPIDILVNNAGVVRDQMFLFMEEEAWNTALAVNLTGSFLCSRAVVRGMMLRRWGRIINIVSASAFAGRPSQTSYSAAKAGMVGLTMTLARETAPHGVLVNAVSPGLIESDMTEGLDQGVRQSILDRVALRRIGRAEEVASVVAFLASDMATYITAQVINVDGGLA